VAKTLVFTGTKGLMKTLASLDVEASKQLKAEAFDITSDIAAKAAGKARSQGGLPALVARNITGRRDRVPTVKMGGSRRLRNGPNQTVGDAMWGAEFGGQRRPTTQQFRPWRGSGSGAGYFLYPAVREMSDDMQKRYGEALLRAIDRSAKKGKKR
jgi:hypothetical protein